MKFKSTLAIFVIAIAAIAQPVLAEFTQDNNGEVTHVNGIPLPPMQTVAEARTQAQKEIAAANKAREAVQAENNQPATRNASPATSPQEVFYTGKPYIEETGQYAFLFRSYDPELSRWTTADPSGFPDGANNQIYAPCPTAGLDAEGLWETRDYVWHYFFGKDTYSKGDAIDMGAVGNGSTIRSFTYERESLYRSEIETHVYSASYNKLSEFSGFGTITLNIDYQPVIFVLGNSNVRIDYDFSGSGSVSSFDNMTYNYSYVAHLQFYINDAFVDALDIKDWFPGNQEAPYGAPFGLVYNWESVISGAGSYE